MASIFALNLLPLCFCSDLCEQRSLNWLPIYFICAKLQSNRARGAQKAQKMPKASSNMLRSHTQSAANVAAQREKGISMWLNYFFKTGTCTMLYI